MTLSFTCPRCDHAAELECTPGNPGRLHGPPEDCFPPEPPEYEPDQCPKCATVYEPEEVWEAVEEKVMAARAYDFEPEERP